MDLICNMKKLQTCQDCNRRENILNLKASQNNNSRVRVTMAQTKLSQFASRSSAWCQYVVHQKSKSFQLQWHLHFGSWILNGMLWDSAELRGVRSRKFTCLSWNVMLFFPLTLKQVLKAPATKSLNYFLNNNKPQYSCPSIPRLPSISSQLPKPPAFPLGNLYWAVASCQKLQHIWSPTFGMA